MDKKLTIGTTNDILARTTAKWMVDQNPGSKLYKLGKRVKLSEIKSGLNAKDFDLVCVPLHQIPFLLPDGLVIAGVSERKDPAYIFVGQPEALEGKTLRDIKSSAVVKANNEKLIAQMKELLPHVNFGISNLNDKDLHAKLVNKKIDGYLIPAYRFKLNAFSMDQLYHWNFSPYELLGDGGDGVVAFMCRMDDIVARTFIKQYHQPETSRCTNVERKISKAFEIEKISAYCYEDERNNYKIHTFYLGETNRRSFYTQSTYDGLAEKMIESIKNEANISHI